MSKRNFLRKCQQWEASCCCQAYEWGLGGQLYSLIVEYGKEKSSRVRGDNLGSLTKEATRLLYAVCLKIGVTVGSYRQFYDPSFAGSTR